MTPERLEEIREKVRRLWELVNAPVDYKKECEHVWEAYLRMPPRFKCLNCGIWKE